MKHLPKLQYISDGYTYNEQLYNLLSALDAGIQWVQIRWKNAAIKPIEKLSIEIKKQCEKYNTILIINDHVHIAKEISADGVHLGLDDTKAEEARKILAPHQWIGGTANTLQHVLQRINENVTYIGLGPLRFTATKEKLSPILGINGYQHIISQIQANHIPIYAIGGITDNDIESLLNTGVYGIAISSTINQSSNKHQYIQLLNHKLYESTQNWK